MMLPDSSTLCRLRSLEPVGGVGVGGGEGISGGVKQGSHAQSLLLRYLAAFKSPEHFACTHPEHMLD